MPPKGVTEGDDTGMEIGNIKRKKERKKENQAPEREGNKIKGKRSKGTKRKEKKKVEVCKLARHDVARTRSLTPEADQRSYPWPVYA